MHAAIASAVQAAAFELCQMDAQALKMLAALMQAADEHRDGGTGVGFPAAGPDPVLTAFAPASGR
jgi:hypothetical protein